MAKDLRQSCPICYSTYEAMELIDVDIDQPAMKHVAHLRICGFCASAIAKALEAATPPPAQPAETKSDEPT